MQITKVSAVPFCAAGAVLATNAKNCGASAATDIPHIMMNGIKKMLADGINHEEIKQQHHEVNRE